MSREDIQKLLGGYATHTLTAEERRALFEAALDDQELFDALAKEQALREVLQDPPARQQVIEALGPAREPRPARAWHWLRRTPALAMAGLVVLIVAGMVLRLPKQARHEVIVADAVSPQAATPQSGAPHPTTTGLPENALPLTLSRKAKQTARLPESAALGDQHVLSEAANKPAAAPVPSQPEAVGAMRQLDELTKKSQAPQPPPPAPSANFVVGALPSASLSRAKVQTITGAIADIKYTVVLKGADGTYTPAPPGNVFHIGDSIRIQAEPAAAGRLSLFRRGAGGDWEAVSSLDVENGQRYELPSSGGIESPTPAHLELRLLFSRPDQSSQAMLPRSDAAAQQAGAAGYAAIKIELEFR
ncbi:MAG TPA: hypothetical protein VKR61_20975 [Bryobacteraceae bacterium]|nr:hypothetical protein [Bryobacteraceae bacterium]